LERKDCCQVKKSGILWVFEWLQAKEGKNGKERVWGMLNEREEDRGGDNEKVPG